MGRIQLKIETLSHTVCGTWQEIGSWPFPMPGAVFAVSLSPSLWHTMPGLTWEGDKCALMDNAHGSSSSSHLCPSQAVFGAASAWLCGFVALLDDSRAHFLLGRALAYAHTCSRHSLELASWKNNSILREKRASRLVPSSPLLAAALHISTLRLLPLRAGEGDKTISSQRCYFPLNVLSRFHMWMLIARAVDVTTLDLWIEMCR